MTDLPMPGDLPIRGLVSVIETFERMAARIELEEQQDEVTVYLARWYRMAAQSHRVNLAAALEYLVDGE